MRDLRRSRQPHPRLAMVCFYSGRRYVHGTAVSRQRRDRAGARTTDGLVCRSGLVSLLPEPIIALRVHARISSVLQLGAVLLLLASCRCGLCCAPPGLSIGFAILSIQAVLEGLLPPQVDLAGLELFG